MTEQGQINVSMQSRISNLETKFESFMREMSEFKSEMRDRDNQRAEDIREIRINLDGMGKQIQNLTIAAVVGFGAIVVAVGGLVFAVFKWLVPTPRARL